MQKSSTVIGLTSHQPKTLPPEPKTTVSDKKYRLHRQFDRLGRIYGDEAVEALMSKSVIVFGLGGVGSFAVESLARSAIGHLMLVDFDEVCSTNMNRQLQCLRGTVGKSKAKLLAGRVEQINAHAKIEYRHQFYNSETADELLTPPWEGIDAYDFVVDCIDNIDAKAHLMATCHAKGIPLISSMGAAGKLDPTQVRIADLADSHGCRLAREMRRLLRKDYNFPKDGEGEMGIQVVFSAEERVWPKELNYDLGKGFKCVCPHKNPAHACDQRSLIDGTVSFVTGTFGLSCASAVINAITKPLMEKAPVALSRQGTIPKNLRRV